MSGNKLEGDEQSLKLVLGWLAIKDSETLEERVAILSRLGYENKEIAQICDTTAGSVSVRKAGLKKPKKKKR
jgi:hypothetical protein